MLEGPGGASRKSLRERQEPGSPKHEAGATRGAVPTVTGSSGQLVESCRPLGDSGKARPPFATSVLGGEHPLFFG